MSMEYTTVRVTSKFSIFEIGKRSSSDQQKNSDKHSEENIFDELYGELTLELASQISYDERCKDDINLNYGEISSISPLKQMLNKIDMTSKNDGKFYDLGSGTGRPVIAASLLNLFKKCVGIEILLGLYNKSVEIKRKYEVLQLMNSTEIDFILGSFLDLSVYDWTDGDVVFVNSTCYSVETMQQISKLAANMKIGTYIITLSRILCPESGFSVIDEERYDMSWGMADFFLHMKKF